MKNDFFIDDASWFEQHATTIFVSLVVLAAVIALASCHVVGDLSMMLRGGL